MIRFVCLLLPLAIASQAFGAAAEDRPNIVLIYGDDIGYGDLGCYGAKTIPTPNIDRLASRGIRFTSGYATSATCTPSRFSLLTGEYAWRKPGRGIAPPNSTALIKPGTPTVASVLKTAGYRTGFVGKWHLGLGAPPKPDWSGEIKPGPLEIGFDECFLMPTTNDRVPCVYVRDHRIVGLDPGDPVDVYDKKPDDQPTGKTHRDSLRMDWTHGHNDSIVNGIPRIGFMTGGHAIRWTDERMGDVFVREAQSFLQRSADNPFFLFYSAHQAHVPRAPNARFAGATPHGPRGDAIVEFDWCVGQLIAELERIGQLDNTLIVLTSDNGPVLNDGYRDGSVRLRGDHKAAGPYRGGKYSRFEGGTRVPWITHWPKRIEPQVSDACLSQVDLLASFAALARETPPAEAGSDSIDLLPALLGEDLSGRESIIQHSGMAAKLAIRHGKWKYIEPSPGPKKTYNTNTELANRGVPQLYDLSVDPGEKNNVYPDHPAVGKDLEERLKAARLGNLQ